MRPPPRWRDRSLGQDLAAAVALKLLLLLAIKWLWFDQPLTHTHAMRVDPGRVDAQLFSPSASHKDAADARP